MDCLPRLKKKQTNRERENQTIHNLLKWKGQFNQNMTAENYVATNTSLKMLLMTINSFNTKNSFSYNWRVKKWEHERSDIVIFKEKQLDEEHLVGLLLAVVATILTHLADVIIRVKW